MKTFPRWQPIFLFLCALMLTACQTAPTQFEPITVNHPQQASAWDLNGKILLTLPEDKVSAQLYWHHQPQLEQMQLNTVLGINMLKMTMSPSQTTLEVDGKSYTDPEPQQLLQRLTGWQIPVSQLPLWFTGQFEQLDILALDGQGRPTLLQTQTKQPWQIHIKSWQTQHPSLPKLIEIKNNTLKIKVQVNQWQALAPKH